MDGIIDSMDMSLSKFWELLIDMEAWSTAIYGVGVLQSMGSQEVQHDRVTELN